MRPNTKHTAAVAALFWSASSVAQQARSISTAEFKAMFRESGIVPQILPATLDPQVSFYASYSRADGQQAQIIPGTKMSATEATFPQEFSVENLQNATNVTAQTRYLIYLLDADAPNRADPTARNFRHYLGGNFTLTGSNSTNLATAQVLRNNSGPFTEFFAPQPGANTGEHRYIYALYTQPARFNTAGFASAGMSQLQSNWNLTTWRTQLGLGPAIGATYFVIDSNPNAQVAQSAAASVGGFGRFAVWSGVVAMLGMMAL